MSSAKCGPFCLGLNVLMTSYDQKSGESQYVVAKIRKSRSISVAIEIWTEAFSQHLMMAWWYQAICRLNDEKIRVPYVYATWT